MTGFVTGLADGRRPLRLAHRGDSRAAPENTLPALEAAMEYARKLAAGPSVAVDIARRCVHKALTSTLEEMLDRFPDWDVDPAGMRLAPTSTVRGWESMPIVLP